MDKMIASGAEASVRITVGSSIAVCGRGVWGIPSGESGGADSEKHPAKPVAGGRRVSRRHSSRPFDWTGSQ